jgi:hypothetical protein
MLNRICQLLLPGRWNSWKGDDADRFPWSLLSSFCVPFDVVGLDSGNGADDAPSVMYGLDWLARDRS